jgi:hypothetical protein
MRIKSFVAVSVALLAGVLLGAALQSRPRLVQAAAPAAPQTAAPVLSGKLTSVKVWDQNVETYEGSNSASTLKEGRVDLYENFIVLTRPDGGRTVVRNGYYTELWFRSE